jgi:hypothetical protein
MPKKPAPKDAGKRTKKPGKIADLPAKSLKGKDAAAVKGGLFNPTNGLKIDQLTGLKIDSTALKIEGITMMKI